MERRRMDLGLGLGMLMLASLARAGFLQDYLIDPDDGMLDASRYLSEVPFGFLPVPTIITEPAVGYGFGLGALFFHESPEQRDARTEQGALVPQNVSIAGGGFTENGTRAGGVGHLGFWKNDSLRYRGFLLFGSVNLDFYSLPGIGELPRPVELNMKGPFVFQELKYRVSGTGFFLGARQMYRSVDTAIESQADVSGLPPAIADWFDEHTEQDIQTSGVGVVAEFDTRDNPFNPQKGFYYSANYMVFDDAIGSDVDYQSFKLSALNYWMLGEKLNLGLRMELDGVDPDGDDQRLPAYVPPYVNLRGVSASQYQGNRVAVAEVQLDYKLGARWKIGAFTGMGRAAAELEELGSAEHVYNFGTGFRYLVARRYGFVMGIDIARGPDETAFYIKAGSTW